MLLRVLGGLGTALFTLYTNYIRFPVSGSSGFCSTLFIAAGQHANLEFEGDGLALQHRAQDCHDLGLVAHRHPLEFDDAAHRRRSAGQSQARQGAPRARAPAADRKPRALGRAIALGVLPVIVLLHDAGVGDEHAEPTGAAVQAGVARGSHKVYAGAMNLPYSVSVFNMYGSRKTFIHKE